ncbi:MAG TPA: response regulator [Thermoanaerobaculia bacterium]|nr:response regulator [Thermoanaerobaculia bacterium]
MGAEVRRVLIADADPAIRQQLFSALLELDIFSDCVANTQDAIEKLENERYGLLLIDVALPTGNVEDVIARVQQMVPAQRPVVLVLAAKPEAARTLDVDIVQIVLRRPVVLRQLVDLVRSCLRSAGARVVDPPKQTKGDQLIS